MDIVTLSLAKKYVDDTANGLGAVKGAAAVVESITPVEGGNNVVFAWTGTDGTKQTQTMFVANGKESALDDFIANTDIAHLYDETTGTSYTAIRVYKKKTDGTLQYPFVFAPNGAGEPVLSTLGVAMTYGFPLTINAGCGGTFGSPNGTLIQGGTVIQQGPTEQHPTALPLTIDSNGDLWYAEANDDAETMVANGIVSAVCGFMPIIKEYEAVPSTEWNTGIDHYETQAQRQIIGQYANGDYAIITCEGRNFANSPGWTIEQAQNICINLGLKFAYNLDGGGSTSVVIGKKQLNLIYEGSTGRKVPAFIVFNGGTVSPKVDIPEFAILMQKKLGVLNDSSAAIAEATNRFIVYSYATHEKRFFINNGKYWDTSNYSPLKIPVGAVSVKVIVPNDMRFSGIIYENHPTAEDHVILSVDSGMITDGRAIDVAGYNDGSHYFAASIAYISNADIPADFDTSVVDVYFVDANGNRM